MEKHLHVVGSLFVDDTDLEHFAMEKEENANKAYALMQERIINWGHLLIATGGKLKQSKCFYHLISSSWKADGT
jgi:hypothetical protein